MNDINPCGNHELLVTYLYDECEPAQRPSIAAHVAICASCAEELRALGDVRVHLAAWSPPALPLGFQITRAESEQPPNVLRPARWWRQPLPAWAQAAAAAVIFAAGMSLGAARSGDAVENGAAGSDTRVARTAPVAVNTVSRDDFVRLEARLQSIERDQSQQVSTVTRATNDGARSFDDVVRAGYATVDERGLFERMSTFVDARIAQGERQNMRLVAQEIDRLDGRYEQLSSRTDVLEGDSEDFRRVVSRGYSSSSMVRPTSLQTGGR